MIIKVSFVSAKIATTIGIKIPKVPQEVPVANAKKHPIRKMIAGKKNSEITEQEQELLKAIDEGADYVDRSRIAELVRFIKE